MIHITSQLAFDENDLVTFIQASGRDYIIQGQQQESLSEHTKPQSLDYWLRERFPAKQDDKLAVNSVADALVLTGRFEIVENLECPDTGRLCKALRLN